MTVDTRMTWKDVVKFGLYALLFPLIIFVISGRWDWWQGWVYVLLTVAFGLLSRLLLAFKHPSLIAERARYTQAQDVKEWDRLLVQLVALVGPLVMLIVCGLDVRFGWSPPIGLGWQLAVLVVFILGYLGGTWAFLENEFFSAVVRIQKERGHKVVDSGPYHFLRHPGYASSILTFLATPVFLGALWGLIPAGLTAALVILRTALEDRVLREELPGYQNYAKRTRYRLFPGVW